MDLPLNSRGEAQLDDLIDQLQQAPFSIIYTAPCDPSRQTAVILGEAFNVPVKELEGLENLDPGLWQGMQVDDIKRKHPKVFKQWQDSPESVCPPSGETVEDAAERIERALEKPLKRGIPFAVVVPEPLASVVSHQITGRKLDLSASFCCEQRILPRWEVLEVAHPVHASH